MQEENEIIIKALGEIPSLVNSTKAIIESDEKLIRTACEIARQKAIARIPDEDIDAIVKEVNRNCIASIKQTRCSMPDTTILATQITNKVKDCIKADIESEVKLAVKDAIKDEPLKVLHEHTTLRELVSYADKKLVDYSNFLFIIAFAFMALFLYSTLENSNSDSSWGARYRNVYASKYITQEEKDLLKENAYIVAALPDEYYKSPKAIRAKIRQNEKIIKQRKKEVKQNKGMYSPEPHIRR